MKVAVVGATGLVGQIMLKVLTEWSCPVHEFYRVASQSSIGKKVIFNEREHAIV